MDTPGSKQRVSGGDWICSDPSCANLNFSRRTACNRCNKEKESISKKKLGQEIGKVAAEKSKGLFSADDWLCNKCCNINWARRQQCNMCNAPKFGDVEERTGYGGGYNDRGIVEYVKRDESDDEYDEFGRKKKKKKYKTSNSTASTESDYENSDSGSGKLSGKNFGKSKVNENSDDENELDKNNDEEEEEEDELDEEESDGEDLSKYDLTEWDDFAVENNTDQKIKDYHNRFDKNSTHSRERSRSRSPR